MSQAPSIVIELNRLPGGGAELKFRRTKDGAALPLRIERPDERITALRRELPFMLGDFRRAVASADIDLNTSRMDNAVFHLRAISYYMLGLLARGSGFDAASFATALSNHLYPALAKRRDDHVPLIEFLAPEGDELAPLLPVELLPLPSVRESEITAFLGFHAIVVRRRSAVSRPPLPAQKIPTQHFAYSGTGLKGAARQTRYFNCKAGLEVDQNWPTSGFISHQDAIKALASKLLGALNGASDSSRKIAHFHCHFAPAGINPEGVYSSVATLDFGGNVTIPVPTLYGTMAQTSAGKKTWAGEVLVFLNACQTGSTGGIGGSLVEHFLAAGFKHIIGSETLIPDGLAAFFAERVYDSLLDGQNLGSAVHRARRDLVEHHGNPGGVLWSVFGDPDLKLRHTANA